MYSPEGPWTLRWQSEQARSQHISRIQKKIDWSLTWNWWYRSYEQIPTLLSLATASEMDVLKSSGLFWARVVIRLVAAVTTPWKQINTLIPACRFSCMQDVGAGSPACSPNLRYANQHALTLNPHRKQRHMKTYRQKTDAKTKNSAVPPIYIRCISVLAEQRRNADASCVNAIILT